jgi:hypothetical protein
VTFRPFITASGFFQSVAGQNGGIDGASATTFLSGGGSGVTKTANYGYTTTSNGFFQLQPIIVGVGSTNTNVNNNAIGCGASAGIDGEGGPGMVLIASW